MKKRAISVIVVNWNGRQHLEECLHSLSKQTIKNFEVILVDNGSTDGSADFVQERFPHVTIVRCRQN
ncbi:glycosyltransferase [bacterium]|nr:glycosyltransferase [bacterium]